MLYIASESAPEFATHNRPLSLLTIPPTGLFPMGYVPPTSLVPGRDLRDAVRVVVRHKYLSAIRLHRQMNRHLPHIQQRKQMVRHQPQNSASPPMNPLQQQDLQPSPDALRNTLQTPWKSPAESPHPKLPDTPERLPAAAAEAQTSPLRHKEKRRRLRHFRSHDWLQPDCVHPAKCEPHPAIHPSRQPQSPGDGQDPEH